MHVLLIAIALAAGSPSADCSYDKAAMLALSAEKFDQDLKGGWRPLAEKPACLPVAADLIAEYRRTHWGELNSGDLHESYWHEGQLRAASGDSARAVPLLLAGVEPGNAEDAQDYALGTVAFLQRDLAALKAARARLVATPEPAWFKAAAVEAKARFGRTPAWPNNLDVLDGFIACFDKPYAQAYEYACRPAEPQK